MFKFYGTYTPNHKFVSIKISVLRNARKIIINKSTIKMSRKFIDVKTSLARFLSGVFSKSVTTILKL